MAGGVKFDVRTALDADVEALIDMRDELQRHMKARNANLFDLAPGWRHRKRDFYLRCIIDPQCHLAVAIAHPDTIVGMGLVRVIHNPDYSPQSFGSLDDVWVAARYRRRGVGVAIVAALVRFLRRQEIGSLTLNYAAANSEAESFWRELGFEPALIMANADRRIVEQALDGTVP